MNRAVRWYDYITINIYWFALTTRAQVLAPLVVPLLVQQFVGEEAKGTYVGIIRLWALMAALLVQALMGMLSDHSTSRWGRRRPFIFVGAIGEVFIFVLIGFTAGMIGMAGFWVLFLLYVISMFFSNIAHAATQPLISDLAPEDKVGRFSGVKALLELPVPLIFVSFVVGGLVSAGNLWGAIFVLCAVILICMAIAMFIPEVPQKEPPFDLDWQPFIRLVLMAGAFTVIILLAGAGAKSIMGVLLDLSRNIGLFLTGFVGLVAMGLTVLLGVWVSIRISIGPEIKENRSFTWWVVNRLTFLVASTNLATFVVFFLQDRFVIFQGEKAAGPAARIVMFVGIFILLSALPSGWLADRFGKKLLVGVSGLLATIGTIFVILGWDLTLIYVGACFIGAAVGLFYSSNWALGTEIVPPDQAGRYLGISNLAGAGAGAVGAYIGGPIADSAGYVVLFSIYGMLFFLSIFALKGIKTS